MFVKFYVFRIYQLQLNGGYTLSYEEKFELCNLENRQFEELIIQLSLNYYKIIFKEDQPKHMVV